MWTTDKRVNNNNNNSGINNITKNTWNKNREVEDFVVIMNDREMSCNSGGQFMDRGRMNQNGVVQPLLTGKYDFAFNGVVGVYRTLLPK